MYGQVIILFKALWNFPITGNSVFNTILPFLVNFGCGYLERKSANCAVIEFREFHINMTFSEMFLILLEVFDMLTVHSLGWILNFVDVE